MSDVTQKEWEALIRKLLELSSSSGAGYRLDSENYMEGPSSDSLWDSRRAYAG